MKFVPVSLLALLTALRLWLAATLAVTPLEAYYWLCAHRLDWAFFDGPPGCAWLAGLGTDILGDGPLGLRFVFPLFAALASLAIFLFGRALFGPTAGLWAAVTLNTLPFFNIAAVHAGPELPALAFTLFAAWQFLRAFEGGIFHWLLAGIFLLLAVLFRNTALLLLPGIAIACALSHRHRAEWRRPGIYLMAGLALSGLIPSGVWNQAHDWPAFALGTWRTALTPWWNEILPAVTASVTLFSIPALLAIAFSKWPLFREARLHPRPRVAICLATPFALLWLYGLLHGEAGSSALLFAVALFAAATVHVFSVTPHGKQIGAAALLITAGLAAFPPAHDPWTRSTRGIAWHDIAAAIDPLLARAQKSEAPPLLLIAQDPDATAVLNYHLSHTSHPEVFLRESQDVSNQFALWPRYDDFIQADRPPDDFFKQEGSTINPYLGRNALYLTDEEPSDLPQTITAAFARVSPFAKLTPTGGRKLRVYLCEDYQTMPL